MFQSCHAALLEFIYTQRNKKFKFFIHLYFLQISLPNLILQCNKQRDKARTTSSQKHSQENNIGPKNTGMVFDKKV